MKKLRALGMAIGAALVAATAASGARADAVEDELVAKAKAEGQLMIYGTSGEPVLRALSKAFEEKYGIKANYVRAVGSDTSNRFAAERGAGVHQVDVYQNTNVPEYRKYSEEGVFQTLSADNLPALKEYPQGKSGWEGTFGLVSMTPFALYYNTELIPENEVPKTWCDVANPKWKGKIGLDDPKLSLTSQYEWLVINQVCGDEFVRTVGEMASHINGSATDAAQLTGAGETVLWIFGTHQAVVSAKKAGAPVDGLVFAETSGVERYIGAIADGPSPNAGRLFVNFTLSADGQKIFNADGGASQHPEAGIPYPASYKRNNAAEGAAALERINGLINERR